MKNSARLLLAAALAATGCRAIVGIDDKHLVDGGATASSSGGGPPCGSPDDPRNCGVCGHDCEGGACKDGVCQPYILAVEHDLARPSGLAVPGDGYVYYGNFDVGTVRRAEDGVVKTVNDLVAQVPFTVRSLIVHPDGVFFSTSNGTISTPVYRAEKIGGGAVALDGSWYLQFGLAADEDDLYVTDASPEKGCLVSRVPKDGSASTVLVHDPAGACMGVAIDETYLYATDHTQGRVVRVDKNAPGAVEVLEANTTLPFPVAVDGTHVYWATRIALLRKSKDGSGAAEQLASFSGEPDEWPIMLVLDGDHVYYTAPGYTGTGVIGRVKKEFPPPPPEILAKNVKGAQDLVVTSQAFYWIAQFDYSIMKMVR